MKGNMKLQKALVGFVGLFTFRKCTLALCGRMKKLIAIAIIGLALNGSAQTINFTTTNEAVKTRAKYLVRSGIITTDRVNGNIHVSRVRSPNVLEGTNYVYLDASIIKGQKPSLVIGAVHYASGWIFATRVDFKIGESVITLTDDNPVRDVMGGDVVWEGLTFPGDRKSSQIVIKAIATGRCKLCALRGSSGERAIDISKEDFVDVLMVYYALGGQPLNATE
jgi:hypothetical protein